MITSTYLCSNSNIETFYELVTNPISNFITKKS